MSEQKQAKVVSVPRQLIGGRLHSALDDEDQVAMLIDALTRRLRIWANYAQKNNSTIPHEDLSDETRL